jgi:16S rRNA processing protein RimM
LHDKPVTLAAIVGAHGVTGEVRLKLFGQGTESLTRHGKFEANGRTLTLKSVRPGPNGAVARFAEIADRTGAEGLRGTALTVPRASLPPLEPDEYYHVDLIDLPCVSSEGEELGRICAVENFGAGDVLEIERPVEAGAGAGAGAKPKRFMVPIKAADIGEERAVIDALFVA